MAFTGSIKGWSITEMLQLIRTMRKTGAMVVQSATDYGDRKQVVYFRNGMVIAVDTGSEDLGAILLEENYINRADLDEAIRLQKTNLKGKRIEQILAAMKKVDAPRLVRAIRIQIERVITMLLQEKNAKVSFDPEAPLRVQALSNGVDVQNILMNAAVKVDELKLVRETIPNTSVVPRRTKRGDDNLKEIALKLDEWKVFLALDGKTDIKTIIMKLKMDDVLVLKAIAFFIQEKWVEIPQSEEDTRKKILIVDDSAVIRKSIEMALSDTGYGLISAATGEAAIKLADEQNPDLILLDVMLPDTTGLKVCKTLRADFEALKNIPIIMLSAKDAEIDKNLGLHAGANDYITKPFKDGQLVEIVHKYLKN